MLDEPLTREQLENLARNYSSHHPGEDMTVGEAMSAIKSALYYEARLREVEALVVATSERADRWQDRAENAEAERDLAKQELGGATLLLNYAEARVAELEQQTYSKTEFDNPHKDHEAHQQPDGTPL